MRTSTFVRPLRPCNPSLHAAYLAALWSDDQDPLPPDIRAQVDSCFARRLSAPEDRLDSIDREIIAATWWYALRPDEIARNVLHLHCWRSPLTIDQAALVVAALGEAGYPITGNGAPDYDDWQSLPPVRGPERDRVLWAAAYYWAEAASEHLTYVSFGDSRGYLPRHIQYDQPGSMAPGQKASLTLGPLVDRGDECDSTGYMRQHTRRLILVAR